MYPIPYGTVFAPPAPSSSGTVISPPLISNYPLATIKSRASKGSLVGSRALTWARRTAQALPARSPSVAVRAGHETSTVLYSYEYSARTRTTVLAWGRKRAGSI